MADNIENKFWMVLPYKQVRDLPQLVLSPAAVKEEREQHPRLLCDHSWDFGWPSINKVTKPSIGYCTTSHMPTPSMVQCAQANTTSRTDSIVCSCAPKTVCD